jgi:hypothetical protein
MGGYRHGRRARSAYKADRRMNDLILLRHQDRIKGGIFSEGSLVGEPCKVRRIEAIRRQASLIGLLMTGGPGPLPTRRRGEKRP